MINFKAAQKSILSNLYKPKTEYVLFSDSVGSVLAQDIFAKVNLPSFPASTMDGICVKTKNTLTATRSKPVVLKIQGVIKAGDFSKKILKNNCAYKISTGAPLPDKSDSVIMKENIKASNQKTIIYAPAVLGDNIKKAGSEIKKDTLALKKGTLITPQLVGFLAALGETKIKIYRKPEVSILVTGNELVSPFRKISFGKLRDTNSYLLKSALETLGIQPTLLGITKDNLQQFRQKIKRGLMNSDIFLITGGISVGEYDYLKDILSELGVKKVFWRAAIRPGKPLYFGKHKNTLVFGLPGNPASAMTTFYEFTRPAILKLTGHKNIFLKEGGALLENTIYKKNDRLYFLRGVLRKSKKSLLVKVLKLQDSYTLKSFREANCLVLAARRKKFIPAGSKVKVHILEA